MSFRISSYIIITVLIAACNQKDDHSGLSRHYLQQSISLPDTISSKLQNGDIIIRKGDGPLSFHLSRTTGEDYTHCGIIYKSKSNEWGVIHTLGADASTKGVNGIQLQSLKNFVRQSADSTLFICRPVFKENIGDSIVQSGFNYLKKNIPFDYRFSLLTKDKFYCTELLYYVFKDVNNQKNIFDIVLKNKSYILLFSTFFKTKNFEPIFKLKS